MQSSYFIASCLIVERIKRKIHPGSLVSWYSTHEWFKFVNLRTKICCKVPFIFSLYITSKRKIKIFYNIFLKYSDNIIKITEVHFKENSVIYKYYLSESLERSA